MHRALIGAALAVTSVSPQAAELIKDLPVAEVKVVTQNGVPAVTGIVTNTTNKQLTSITITFALLDSQGVQVGTAIGAAMGVDPGRSWRFVANNTTDAAFAAAKFANLQAVTE